jgi:hypothetical protein
MDNSALLAAFSARSLSRREHQAEPGGKFRSTDVGQCGATSRSDADHPPERKQACSESSAEGAG